MTKEEVLREGRSVYPRPSNCCGKEIAFQCYSHHELTCFPQSDVAADEEHVDEKNSTVAKIFEEVELNKSSSTESSLKHDCIIVNNKEECVNDIVSGDVEEAPLVETNADLLEWQDLSPQMIDFFRAVREDIARATSQGYFEMFGEHNMPPVAILKPHFASFGGVLAGEVDHSSGKVQSFSKSLSFCCNNDDTKKALSLVCGECLQLRPGGDQCLNIVFLGATFHMRGEYMLHFMQRDVASKRVPYLRAFAATFIRCLEEVEDDDDDTNNGKVLAFTGEKVKMDEAPYANVITTYFQRLEDKLRTETPEFHFRKNFHRHQKISEEKNYREEKEKKRAIDEEKKKEKKRLQARARRAAKKKEDLLRDQNREHIITELKRKLKDKEENACTTADDDTAGVNLKKSKTCGGIEQDSIQTTLAQNQSSPIMYHPPFYYTPQSINMPQVPNFSTQYPPPTQHQHGGNNAWVEELLFEEADREAIRARQLEEELYVLRQKANRRLNRLRNSHQL